MAMRRSSEVLQSPTSGSLGARRLTEVKPVALKQDLIDACGKAAQEQAGRLPQNSSDERMYRNRMPACKLDLMLRQGVAIEEVADQAALRVVERWARLLQREAAVPFMQLAPTIAELTRNMKMEMPVEPLRSALLRVVPEPGFSRQWKFMEELIETFIMEQQFDRKSYIHVPPPTREEKLSLLCGGPPPVWQKGKPRPTFSRMGLDMKEKQRTTSVVCDRDRQAWAFVPRPSTYPGPGTYSDFCDAGMQSPRRAEFASVGRPRTPCLFSSLSTFPRRTLGLEDPLPRKKL